MTNETQSESRIPVALLLEYDGSEFFGWQCQPDRRSIEVSLLEAIRTVSRAPVSHVWGSGRTDAGVHALAQVCHFYLPPEHELLSAEPEELSNFAVSISSLLRGEVSVLAVCPMPEAFHARKSAVSKQYLYRIQQRRMPPVYERGRVWHVRSELNLDLMRAQLESLRGERDFSSFRASGCGAHSPVKNLLSTKLEVAADGVIELRLRGTGFLKQMVRNIVGSAVEIGRGFRDDSLAEILEQRDRRVAGATAPAAGLFLERVYYPKELVSDDCAELGFSHVGVDDL